MSRREDVDNAIWQDPDFIDLSADARYLYLWSFTNPRCGMAGLYKLSLAPIPAETGLTMRRIIEALKELADAAFAYYQDGVFWVRSRVSHLRSASPNIAKSIANDVEKLRPEHPLRIAFLSKYRQTPWLREQLSRFPLVEPNQETVTEPSPDRLQTVQGKGKGKTRPPSSVVNDPRDAEWTAWLTHYQQTTGRTSVQGSAEARGFFNARRETFSLEELEQATVGCHSEPRLVEKGFDRPETILRASKVERYVQLAASAKPKTDRSKYDAGTIEVAA